MYNEYVYPAYDKSEDINAPIPNSFPPNGFLEQINYYNYNGSNDFNNFNVLVAGVGLGSDIISMNYLLKKRNCLQPCESSRYIYECRSSLALCLPREQDVVRYEMLFVRNF